MVAIGNIIGGIVIVVNFVASTFAGVASPLFAGNIGLAGYGQQEVTICHKGKTMTVASPAVAGHLAHGDTVGACE